MNITPENVLSFTHKTWLNDPTTIQMLKNLDKYEKTFISNIASKSGNPEEPEVTFRIGAFGIKTLHGVKSMITDTEKFIETSVK